MPAPLYGTLDEYKGYMNLVYDRLYTDVTAEPQVINDDWFEEDVHLAEAHANKYIECRYDLDLLTAEAKLFIRKIVRAILIREAYGREDFANIPESVQNSYQQASAQLLDIRDGEFCASWTTADPEADPDEAVFPYVDGCEPIFSCEDTI